MMQVSCEDVDASMPGPLRQRVMELLISRGSDAMQCGWVGSAATSEDLLELLTEHVQEQHAMRSWPPEYWVHVKACIRPAD